MRQFKPRKKRVLKPKPVYAAHIGSRNQMYPSDRAIDVLEQHFGVNRKIYNLLVGFHKQEYSEGVKFFNRRRDSDFISAFKEQDGYEYLKAVNGQTIQTAIANVHRAYKNFFKGNARLPVFHKKTSDQCFHIAQNFHIKNGMLYIPKLKEGIKINLSRPLPGKPLYLDISRTASGKYYASFTCGVNPDPLPKNDNTIGIDVGLKVFATFSTGEIIDNPKFFREAEKELKYRSRQLSKKQKNSKRRQKARKQLAVQHEKVANRRKDFTHKASRKLIDENQIILTELLAVKNMMKNHCLAKSITDVAWGEFFRQLKYKSEWYGRTFFQIDRFYPSSKTCFCCKHLLTENEIVDIAEKQTGKKIKGKLKSLPLNIRNWDCPACGANLDRDANAAMNIEMEGLRSLEEKGLLKNLSGYGTQSDVKQKLGEALSAEPKKRKLKTSNALVQDGSMSREASSKHSDAWER